jgi:eukaryotic-like serine/threonine-protein kinase
VLPRTGATLAFIVMPNTQQQTVRDLLLATLERPAGDRAHFLDEASGGDTDLRAEIESLVAALEFRGDFLTGRASADADREGPGSRVAGYKLLQLIGEGGFGSVYMAEQAHPIRRTVAVKVLKGGLDSVQVVARFEAERQALALMDHPNIAKVLDAGATDSGRPYFVMELVKGVPITKYCDDHHLTPRQRLELFVPVCQAVQHAHQKGIIHRDLKPSNVLIALYDGRPVPKVIDFGVAKAMGSKLTERTMFTAFGQMVGTLEYMSPEQAELNQLDVDTRSDIYSLGVLLYELVTGTTPLESRRLNGGALLEALRVIREEEPPCPSTRLSTAGDLPSVALNRGLEPRKLSGLVKGELDWIVMKCLEKDRSRRYETANGVARDVERYLRDEAVVACPPSAAYRLRKLARRNRTLLAAGAVAVAALLAGTAVSTWLAVRATRAEALAQHRLTGETAERRQAVAAREDAKRRLYDTTVAQARAGRRSRQVGQRFDSWEAVGEAARLGIEMGHANERLFEIRNEAIACLALTDVRPIGELKAWPRGTEGVAFDADLSLSAQSDAQGNISVRRLADGREEALLPGQGPGNPGTGAPDVWFSPDGTMLAARYHQSQGQTSNFRVWDWRHRKVMFELPASYGWVGLDFSPDGSQVALGFPDRTLSIRETHTGREVRRFTYDFAPCSIAYHPDAGKLAAAGLRGRSVQLRDAVTHRLLGEWPYPGGVHHVAWHPSGDVLAAGCDDGTIRLRDVGTGVEYSVLRGHQGPVVAIAFAPDGQVLMSWSWDGTTRLWDPWTGRELLRFPGWETRFSRDGRRLASAAGGKITVWEVASASACRSLTKSGTSDSEAYFGGDIHPRGRLLAHGTSRGIRLWDLSTETSLAFLAVSQVTDVKFDRQGTALFTSGPSGLYRWSVKIEANRLRIGPPQKLPVNGRLERMELARDSRSIAVADWSSGGRVLDPENIAAGVTSFDHPGAIWAVISPGGEWVATSARGAAGVKVWNARTGAFLADLPCGGTDVALTFSPDGRWLVTSGGAEVVLWTVGAWEPVRRIICEPFAGGAVAFSCDGAVMAITRSRSVVRLVDPSDGRLLADLEAPEADAMNWMGFTPDGDKLVVSATSATTANAWVWDLGQLRDRLREIGLNWPLPASAPTSVPAPGNDPIRVEVGLGRYDLGHDPGAYLVRADGFGRRARWAEAADDHARALELDPTNHFTYHNDSVLLLELGDVDGYRRVCREMLARFGTTGSPNVAERTAKTCLLAPGAVDDYPSVVRLAELAVMGTETSGDYKWFVLARGIADYRTGKVAESIEWLRKSLSPDAPLPYRDGLAHLFLAMAHHRLGLAEQSARSMTGARD